MGVLQFAAALVNSLAWPAVVVVSVVLLRPELSGAFQRLENFEFAGLKATLKFPTLEGFERMVEAAAADAGVAPDAIAKSEETEFSVLEALAAAAPKQAVIDAWSLLEYQLNVASDRLVPDGLRGWPQVAHKLKPWPMWKRLEPAAEELWRLRNYTLRSSRQPTPVDAARYVAVVQDLVTTIRNSDLTEPGDGPGGGE